MAEPGDQDAPEGASPEHLLVTVQPVPLQLTFKDAVVHQVETFPLGAPTEIPVKGLGLVHGLPIPAGFLPAL